ncbi:MAG TPA: hypothetical protein VMT23_03705 [Candidatus Binatia bacterium]|nr:hypothetical protein [Candidatus Binatia bacterium]
MTHQEAAPFALDTVYAAADRTLAPAITRATTARAGFEEAIDRHAPNDEMMPVALEHIRAIVAFREADRQVGIQVRDETDAPIAVEKSVDAVQAISNPEVRLAAIHELIHRLDIIAEADEDLLTRREAHRKPEDGSELNIVH